MRRNWKIIGAAALFGLGFWVIDSILDYFIFYAGDGLFIELLITNVPPHESYVRTLFFVASLIAGFILEYYARRLKISEEHYRNFFDNALVGLYRSRISDGLFIEVNPISEVMIGLPLNEIVGKLHATDLFRDLDQRRLFLDKLQQDGEVHDFEVDLSFPDGRESTFSISAKAYPDEDYLEGTLNDVTDRKQAEEALRESEEQLLEAQRIGHIGNFWHDMLTDESYWSDEMFRITACERGEMTWEWLDSIIHPEDLPRLHGVMKAARAGQRHSKLDFRIVRPDGDIRSVQGRWESFFDGAGNEIRQVGTAQDITDRKLVEGALRESEENFQAFFNAVDDFMIVATTEGRILYANPAVSDKLGYSIADLASMHMLDLRPADKRKEAKEHFAEVIRGERDTCHFPLVSRDGVLIPVETRVWFGKWSGEDSLFCISKDLSAEQEAEQCFESIFRLNPTPMALSSLLERKFVDVNDAYVEVIGYSRDEIIGKTSVELGLSVNPEQQTVLAEQLAEKGRIANSEMQVRRKDGTILDGIFWGEVINSQGQQYFLTTMMDITDRKRAGEALRESEELLLEAQRIAHVGSFSCNLVTDKIYWSDEIFRIIGRERQEVTLELFISITHPDDLPRLQEALNTAQAGQRYTDLDFRIVRPDGEVRYIQEWWESFFDDAGNEIRQVGVAQDITDRKRAEEELNREKAFSDATIDSLPGIFYLFDEHGRFLRWNLNLETVSGYSADEIAKMKPEELFVQDERDDLNEAIREVFEKGWSSIEVAHLSKDGSTTPFLLTGARFESEDTLFLVGMGLDISERKQAEKEIRKFKTIADNANYGVALANPDGNLVYVNETWSRMHGNEPDDEIGRHLSTLHPEDEMDRVNELNARILAEGGYSCEEVRHMKNDGTVFPVLMTASFITDDKGKSICLAASGIDITDRKRAAAEREAIIANLEAANAELERFTYTVSHDFKSPLITIEGFLGILAQDIEKGKLDKVGASIQRIDKAARTMQELLDDLLELSRVGRMVNPMEEIQFREIVSEALSMTAGQITESGIDVNVLPDLPVVYCDSTRMREVVQNLISNAVNFMGEQSKPLIEIGGSIEGEFALCYVRDNGIGIDTEYHEKIFELFDTLDRSSDGTGIGLALVKRIIEFYGGKVWVESEGLGHGSTFWFTLPVKKDGTA